MDIEASTIQFTYQAIDDAIRWYGKLFGRTADFVSSKEFQEWEIYPSSWLQIAKGTIKKDPQRLRFGVADIEKVMKELIDRLNIKFTDKFYTEGVVLLYNFDDPWGYKLGLFQDLKKYPIS